jgi:hypothetical protein
MKTRSIFVQLAAASQFGICMAVIAIASMGRTAVAASIPVTNYSFENPNTGDCCGANATIPGWQFADGGDATGTQNQGVNNPTGTDGNYWAFLNLSGAGANGTITSTAPATTFAPITKYELTVAVGSNTQLDYGYFAPGNFTVSILANGTPVASGSVSGASLTLGTLTDLSTTFTTGVSGGVVGDALTIQLYSHNDGNALINATYGGEQSLFDNVRLTAIQLPEPSSVVALCGLGAMGLFLFARRRRKS